MSQTRAWLPEKYKGVQKASVDGKEVPYGKENAKAFTDSQLDRLRDGDVPIQTESGSDENNEESASDDSASNDES